MKRKWLGAVLMLVPAAVSADSQTNNAAGGGGNQTITALRTIERTKYDRQNHDLKTEIERIAKVAGGRVGVAVSVLETGEKVVFNSGKRFPMQSVYKLPIGMAVLSQVDAGKIRLDQTVRIEKNEILKTSRILSSETSPDGADRKVEELLRLMVSESDNTASDALLRLVGGPGAVMSYLNTLGINEIIVANSEREFAAAWEVQYRNWATPEAAVELLRALNENRGLTESSRKLLIKFMTESPTGPRRLKGLLPAEAFVAHKTGTSGTRKGITAATNDIGIVRLPNGKHLAIAVFVSDSPAGEATREETIARIARAAWDYWSRK